METPQLIGRGYKNLRRHISWCAPTFQPAPVALTLRGRTPVQHRDAANSEPAAVETPGAFGVRRTRPGNRCGPNQGLGGGASGPFDHGGTGSGAATEPPRVRCVHLPPRQGPQPGVRRGGGAVDPDRQRSAEVADLTISQDELMADPHRTINDVVADVTDPQTASTGDHGRV